MNSLTLSSHCPAPSPSEHYTCTVFAVTVQVSSVQFNDNHKLPAWPDKCDCSTLIVRLLQTVACTCDSVVVGRRAEGGGGVGGGRGGRGVGWVSGHAIFSNRHCSVCVLGWGVIKIVCVCERERESWWRNEWKILCVVFECQSVCVRDRDGILRWEESEKSCICVCVCVCARARVSA